MVRQSVILSSQSKRKSTVPKYLSNQEVYESRISTYKQRKDTKKDVFVCTYPKSGTTFGQMILYSLVNGLPTSDLQVLSPWIECNRGDIETNPSPMVIKSHLPFPFIKEDIDPELTSKYVYIARNGKSVVTSYFHFLSNHIKTATEDKPSFETFLGWFLEEDSNNLTDWFAHVAEYYQASLDHPDSVLFLFYEDLLTTPKEEITKIAKFIGLDLNEERIDQVVHESSFSVMKKNPLANRSVGAGGVNNNGSSFMRSGKKDSWKELFSDEALAQFTTRFNQSMLKQYPSLAKLDMQK